MVSPFKPTKVASYKTVSSFADHLRSLGVHLPIDETLITGSGSPLLQPILASAINQKWIGNRWAIHPMEGWDATTSGFPTEDTQRRWIRFGQSGAKLIFGCEAMAVRADGRANPNQLILNRSTVKTIAAMRESLVATHRQCHGQSDDLVVGFQLTHSGRYSRPNDKKTLEPKIAYRHPILDERIGIRDDSAIMSDDDIRILIQDYVEAAALAREAGADFVDIKHCHGYLLHEFLGAHLRTGVYGGALENRTRILREIVEGIRSSGNDIEIAVRLSAFDMVPFHPDPESSTPSRPGAGVPADFSKCLPYFYGFGVNPENPLEMDLSETHQFIQICSNLGIKLINLSAGSPYYNPHIQRPAAYPPSDGYLPSYDPLMDVARQIYAVRELRAKSPKDMILIGTAYSYLQEYLPNVAQALIRAGWVDSIGLGRASLSYPTMLLDATQRGCLTTKQICRTLSDCTTAPRNGLPSGCYPLDPYYQTKPESKLLKELKR